MQKKINRAITIIVSLTIIVFSIISVFSISGIYFDKSRENIENIARLSVKSGDTPEEIAENVKDALDSGIRVTYILSDGTVEFDSEGAYDKMENHSDRKEVADAFKKGEGSDTRVSQTFGKSTYYFAIKYGDGVIRFSSLVSNIFSLLFIIVPVFLALCVLMLIIARAVSKRISKSVIRPLTKIVDSLKIKDGVPEDFSEDIEYEELKPIVSNITYISARLQKYIRRLKREKERVTLITDNMVEGMILIDEENTVLSVNRSAAAILNPDFVTGDEPKKITELTGDDRILSMLKTLDNESSVYKTVDIDGRFYRVHMNKSEFAEGFGIIILLIDATESVKSEKIRHDFSANVTHELKTPLTTIKGFGEMLENGIITGADDVKKYGGTIFRESERLLLLINDIIRLSEIEEQTIELESVRLDEVAYEVADILSHKAQQHDVEIILDVQSVTVMANRSYANELLINLADNSIKYNTKGGYVKIIVKDIGSRALIVVEDNGIGIPKESQERIFERFYRVDKSRSKQTGGTGLGLSIVKHIVTYHSGTISLKSSVGKGTKVIITLPKLQ